MHRDNTLEDCARCHLKDPGDTLVVVEQACVKRKEVDIVDLTACTFGPTAARACDLRYSCQIRIDHAVTHTRPNGTREFCSIVIPYAKPCRVVIRPVPIPYPVAI